VGREDIEQGGVVRRAELCGNEAIVPNVGAHMRSVRRAG
jgi:hypothetical protein